MASSAERDAKAAAAETAWRGFQSGIWCRQIDVRDFIQQNYEPYDGDGSFLAPATPRTQKIWSQLQALFVEERRKGVLDVSQIPSSITAHAPGYIDRANEIIVGLQTDAPLKRAIMPNGGWRMVESALETYGYKPDPHVVEIFTKHRKTHNDGVFDGYTEEVRRCRASHVLTGLPDAYGRGRIIGDYRRVALYGVERLLLRKQQEKAALDAAMSLDPIIRDREELAEQIRALGELKEMAASYGFDISGPAQSAKEAVQWLYFGYLAGVKEQNGAAMSLGRTSTFLDIYFARDLAEGALTEEQEKIFREGIPLHGRKTSPAGLKRIKQGVNPWYEVRIAEGRQNQIRIMFKYFGRLVEKLRRVKIGFLELDLPPGRYRALTPKEIERFRKTLKLDGA
jgi:formate C-acetyltransferase